MLDKEGIEIVKKALKETKRLIELLELLITIEFNIEIEDEDMKGLRDLQRGCELVLEANGIDSR